MSVSIVALQRQSPQKIAKNAKGKAGWQRSVVPHAVGIDSFNRPSGPRERAGRRPRGKMNVPSSTARGINDKREAYPLQINLLHFISVNQR